MKSHDWIIGPLLAAQLVVFGLGSVAQLIEGHKYQAAFLILCCAFIAFVREARRT